MTYSLEQETQQDLIKLYQEIKRIKESQILVKERLKLLNSTFSEQISDDNKLITFLKKKQGHITTLITAEQKALMKNNIAIKTALQTGKNNSMYVNQLVNKQNIIQHNITSLELNQKAVIFNISQHSVLLDHLKNKQLIITNELIHDKKQIKKNREKIKQNNEVIKKNSQKIDTNRKNLANEIEDRKLGDQKTLNDANAEAKKIASRLDAAKQSHSSGFWSKISGFFSGIWKGLTGGIGGIFSAIFGAIGQILKPLLYNTF